MDAELVLEAEGADVVALAPAGPRSSGRNFGTRNSEMPRLPGGAPGVRASTAWTMFGARSWSP